MTRPTVLHVLSQRPSLTGSGITLDALVRCSASTWKQHAVVGVPADAPAPDVSGLSAERVHGLAFGVPPLDFAVPGMSDVMPYPSTVWSQMSGAQLQAYRQAWTAHLRSVLQKARPDVIHAHHVWLLSSLIRDLAPRTPLVLHCHATGLRQASLCPHLADEVRAGCGRADRFVVLHDAHATDLSAALDVDRDRIHVVGAGYREELFFDDGAGARSTTDVVYIGKYSHAKGLPWLLDAMERLAPDHPGLTLHVAGSGAGEEADALRLRMESLAPLVQLHGQLPQDRLADLLRRCHVCVLPSFYEGVPLVLAEALACGCRLVATDLPGVAAQLTPHLGPWMERVDLPRLAAVDRPEPADLPAFSDRLTAALRAALAKPPARPDAAALAPFRWQAVVDRIHAVWRALL